MRGRVYFVYSRLGRGLCGNFRKGNMHLGGWGGVAFLRDLFELDIRSERLIDGLLRSVHGSLVNCPCADHATHGVLDIDG